MCAPTGKTRAATTTTTTTAAAAAATAATATATNEHPAAESQHQVQRGLLLDAVAFHRAAVLELFARVDQALLVRMDAYLVLDLGFDVVGIGIVTASHPRTGRVGQFQNQKRLDPSTRKAEDALDDDNIPNQLASLTAKPISAILLVELPEEVIISSCQFVPKPTFALPGGPHSTPPKSPHFTVNNLIVSFLTIPLVIHVSLPVNLSLLDHCIAIDVRQLPSRQLPP